MWVDVTPPEIHNTVLRMQSDVIQQQVVYNNQPQQPVCQNRPQNPLLFNYLGGGNNAGWIGEDFNNPPITLIIRVGQTTNLQTVVMLMTIQMF